MRHLLPVSVVVDTENVRGMGEAVLGVRFWPSVPGIVTALEQYGFEAATVAVAVARARPRDLEAAGPTSYLARRHRQGDRLATQVRADARGLVLACHWQRQGNDLSEKAADVACAVEICRRAEEIRHRRIRSETVVVLSADSDLIPALDYATSLGVFPILLGTDDRLAERDRWICLHDPALGKILGVPAEAVTGWALRAHLVAALRRARSGECGPFACERIRTHIDESDCVVHHPLGRLPGVVAHPGQAPPASVYLAGIRAGQAGRRFPRLLCTVDRPRRPRLLATTRVFARASGLVVKIEARGGVDRVHAPLGGIERGTRVVIGERQCLSVEGRVDPSLDRVHLLTVAEPLALSRAVAVDESGERWVLEDPAQELAVGARFAVLAIGRVREPFDARLARPVSSSLPVASSGLRG